ncbi:hypothetical protein LSH36_238g03102 [Paralvinella palmiformis]|uniref:Organic solute transporter subunit alpha n=1 Tax=Paralvinella palmiformis TaxID=53620 RepID=A0AAD9JP05_9ANNE|nr:hypothetical protein LSH36_238g03102 [Paralvinella palmiformis]
MDDNEDGLVQCAVDVPTATEIISAQSLSSDIILGILWACFVFCIAIFIEEVVFIVKHFRSNYRRRKTVYVLLLAPVYSLCSIIGVMVPRTGPLIDLIPSSFYGMAFYSIMCLLGDYLGTERLIKGFNGVQQFTLATPPCCCCCSCLPKPAFTRKNYLLLLMMVYQIALIRPIISFVAAVLWFDGRYVPGLIIADNAFPYLATLNTVSTLLSAWGLLIVYKTFQTTLSNFFVGVKFLYLQLAILGTVIGKVIIACLVTGDVIPCNTFIPSRARALRLDNSFVVVWMVLVSMCGRVAFRRYGDAIDEEELDRKLDVTGTQHVTETALSDVSTNEGSADHKKSKSEKGQ